MRSDAINEIAAALAKAQLKITGALKDSTNPHFKSSYADLSSVWDACHEALNENGIAVVQFTEMRDGAMVLITQLVHSTGQWLGTEWPVEPVQRTPQGMGSALTYARRYSLACLAGVAGRDDDDGNAASVPQNMGNMPQENRPASRAKAQQDEVQKQQPKVAAKPWPEPPETITTMPLALCVGPFKPLAEFDGLPLQNLYAPDLELIVSTVSENRQQVKDESVRKWFTAIEATATLLLRAANEVRPLGDEAPHE